MNRGMYRRLALNNIRKNKNTFFPFSLSCIAMIAMFYMLHSIQMQADDNLFFGAGTMRTILGFGTIICGVFSLFVVFYTNSFLMKRRSKEFGLYSILGMEKKHISRVVFWEIAVVGAGSIIIGLLSGVLFSKLMFLILLKIMHLQTDFAFKISVESLLLTFVLLTALFILIMLVNNIRIFRLKPIDLMSGSHAGEREPKAKWAMAVMGVICLGAGYYLAVTTKNPIQAMGTFFVAVLFVIEGTYLVFVSGSIALLKLLKGNKNYYYQKNHFITVSGMMYRMKQNAVGLSNICILSTAVLVVLSSTVSLYAGFNDIMRTRYPKDVMTQYLYEEEEDSEDEPGHYNYSVLEPVLRARGARYHVNLKEIEQYYSYSSVGVLEANAFRPDYEGSISDMTGFVTLEVMTVEDFNSRMGSSYDVEKGKVLVYTSEDAALSEETVKIAGREYPVSGRVQEVPEVSALDADFGQLWLIVPDLDMMKEIRSGIDSAFEDGAYTVIYYNFNFDLEGKDEDKKAFCTDLRNEIDETGIAHAAAIADSYTTRQELYGIYGSLFFIGIFLGALFLITTVLIIYYKQISEGYEDRERFIIMQKVGMSEREVKSVIRSQVLLVFFLPILLAVVHVCFAFEIIKKLLIIMDFTNVSLFILCTIATVAVFVIVYGIVYSLTAKAYYRITYSN